MIAYAKLSSAAQS